MHFDLAVPHGSRSLSELSSSTDLVGMPIFARALNSIPTAGSREKSRWLRLGRSAAGEGSCCLRELKMPKISSRPLCCDDALLGTMTRAAEEAMDGGRESSTHRLNHRREEGTKKTDQGTMWKSDGKSHRLRRKTKYVVSQRPASPRNPLSLLPARRPNLCGSCTDNCTA